MHKSKLITLLRQVGPKDLDELGLFVSSPFFNKNDEVTTLLEYIAGYSPDFNNPNLTKEAVCKELFPNDDFDDKRISYLMHYLLKLTEDYLAQKGFERDKSRKYYYLLRTYNDLGLQKHYNGALREVRSNIDKIEVESADYYFDNYLLESVNNDHFDKQKVHKYDHSLQKAIDNLDLAYLTVKLKYSCEILNRKNLIATEYQLRLLDVILHYLEELPKIDSALVTMYYHVLMIMMERDADKHYQQLKVLMKNRTGEVPKGEARDIYVLTQNFCIKKINKGDDGYLHELFDQYKIMIANDIIFVEKHLSPWSYKNIVGVAIRVGEYDWAERFIHEYKGRLEPKQQDNAVTYNMATLYFNKRDYDKALELLNQVEFTDLVYNLGAKSMLLRIYYELEEVDALFSLLVAFKKYLKRNKFISEYQRTVHLNLVHFVMELIKIPSSQVELAQQLRAEVESTKQVAYIKWLLEKIDVMATSRSKRA